VAVFRLAVHPFIGSWFSEREELSKLKWIESEKSGYDIGIYKAKAIWFDLHYKEWLEYKKKTIYRDNV